MDTAAKRYSAIKYSLSLVEAAYLLILLFLFLGLGISQALVENISRLAPNNLLIVPLYILIAYLLYYLLSLPLTLYHSFILEHKFHLSTQRLAAWAGDQAKSAMVSYVIFLILFEAFYYILKYNPKTWWFIVSLFWIFFSVVLAKVTPVIIIPLFFKYKKLSDETLRQRIINLAEKLKIKLLDVFEIDFSSKTLKANAAFTGWGRWRRVILADTLKDKYSYDEIEVILAHEFAHYKLKHLAKLILISSAATVISFYFIFRTSGYALSLFGLSSLSDIVALPVVLIYLVIFGIIMQPLENYISRRLERSADIMALEVTGLKGAFISMMEKLASQNLSDRNPHPLIKFFFFDHPPCDERIALAKSFPGQN
ncbi:MAG: M48 family metallopeptidase [Candidatus Omnitrophica bacterium]|nr:M48 family metallopeptidase [Candidatus Omnitrophota bacterium]